MSWFKRILIVLASIVGLILLPVGGLVLYDFYVRAQAEQFYKTHPMLRRMRDLPPTPGTDPSAEMIPVLLERIPIGSARSEAMRILTDEGMICMTSNAPTPNALACRPENRPSIIPRWYVEVKFDKDDRVAGGRVVAFKATD